MMDSRESIGIEDLSAVAEEGQTTNIDNEYSFTRNKPLAMSTVARENKSQKRTDEDVKSGSFLSNNSLSTPPGGGGIGQGTHQLRLSFSAIDQSNLQIKPRDVTGSRSDELLQKSDDSLLSQNPWDPPPYGIGSEYAASTRDSSLGLIQVDAMSDLIGSEFNLFMPGMDKTNGDTRSVQGSSSNESKTGTLLQSASNASSLQSSSQGGMGDSQTAFFRHDIDTVKKKPSEKPAPIPEGPVRQSLVFKEMFSGQQDGDVTLPEVNIDDELKELDDDFGDFDDTGVEDLEPDPKGLTPDNDVLDSIYLKIMSKKGDGAETTQSNKMFPSLSKVTLFDGRVMTPTDVGSSEDLRNMDGKQTGQSSEIDTEDELEMARKSMGLEREVGAGQCSDSQASIPRPGVEGTSQQEPTGTKLSIGMRQSAEGDVVTSPIPGDGGGGGDGSSGSEEGDVRQSTEAKSFLDAFRSNFKPVMPPPSRSLDIEEERVKPMGDDLLTEKGMDRYSQGNVGENESLLQSRYLAPTPMFNASDNGSQLQWTADFPSDLGNRLEASGQQQWNNESDHGNRLEASGQQEWNNESDPGNRLEASGFNAEDAFSGQLDDNPFGEVRNSFGSFGASPPQVRQSQGLGASPSPPFTDHSFGIGASQSPQLLSQSHGASPGRSWHSQESTTAGDVTVEPPISPRTSIGSRGQASTSPPNYNQPKFSLASPQPSQFLRNSQKSLPETKQEEKTGADLAFVSSLSVEAAEQKAMVDEMVAQGNLRADFTINEDFVAADKAKDMLDMDEQEFEKENVFREDEKMEDGNVFGESDSWSYRSRMTVADDDCRISVGQFMKSRSGQLGSLDGDGPRPDFGMEVKTPPKDRNPYPLIETTVVNTPQSVSIDEDATLQMSDLSRFMASVSMSKDPKEIANMVMAWSQKQATLKPSKLPVKRGTNLKFRERNLSSEDMSLSEIPEHKDSVEVAKLSTNDNGRNYRDFKENSVESFSMESKTKPDGEESDTEDNEPKYTSHQTPPRSRSDKLDKMTPPRTQLEDFDGYSPRLSISRTKCQSPGSNHDSIRRSMEKMNSYTDQMSSYPQKDERTPVTSTNQNAMFTLGGDDILYEARSPRTSNSGWAGHHIPDGTEYSKSSELHHTRSRQELEGTEDIQLVDSRGFDAISEKPSQPKPQLDQKQTRHSDFDPRKHHAMLKAQANKHKHSRSAEGITMNGRLQNLTSTPVKDYLGLDTEPELQKGNSHDFNMKALESSAISNINRTDFSHTVPQSIYSQQVFYKQPPDSQTMNGYSSDPGDKCSQNKMDSPGREHSTATNQNDKTSDDVLMPPPQIPSFRHNLLPQKQQPDKPTLLTSESMLSTDFAKEYLVRENPSKLVGRNVHPKPLEHPIDSDGMMPHRDSDIPLPTHYDWTEDNANISTRLPVYQSTPYNNRDTTIITPSSMHTMMSTGMMNELQAENLTVLDDECNATKSSPKRDNQHVRTPPRLTAVTAPRILHFSEVCCVGISTEKKLELTNPTNSWLECYLQVQEWTVDGREMNVMNYLPFEMKRKVIIEPRTSETVTVIFIPKMAGAYVAQLNVTSSLFLQDNSVRTEKIPTVVTLQAIAEDPQIQVRTDSNNKCMNFGEVAWGSCHEMSLQIINRGQATIPLRLSILLSQGSWHAFSFDTKLADISVISRSNRPQSASIGRTVMPLSVPGRNADSDPTVYDIKIYCRPPEKQYNRAMSQYPPTEMFARVEVEVDTPSHLPLISSIDLHSVVGVAKLHLSRQLEQLQFKTHVNQKSGQTFNLRNAGNINMECLLGVIEYQEYFTVNPAQFTIPPGQERPVTVSFNPVRGFTVPSFETILLMRILPQGPDYDLPIRAEVQKEAVVHRGPVLLGDRQFIDFGGVAMGKSLVKRYTLKNVTSSQLKLSLEIRSDTDSFQLLWNDRRSYTRELLVNGGDKFLVNVEYRPSAVRQHHGKLVVKPVGMAVKYSIPLEGYGGTNLLVMEGASIIEGNSVTDQKYLLNFSGIEPNKCQIQKISLRNVGSRAAYVKGLCFTDPSCKHLVRPPRVLIEPNEMVIKAKGASCITVVFNPTERECALCSEGREIVAVVGFLCGDEVSRQRMRRVIRQSKGHKSKIQRSICDENILHCTNFNLPFMDEDMVPDLPSVISDVGPSKDIDLFYRSMSKVSLTLVASAAQSGVYSNHGSNFTTTIQNGGDYGTPQNSRCNLASSVPVDYLSDHLSSKNTKGIVTHDQPYNLPPRIPQSSIPSQAADRLYNTAGTIRMSSMPSSHLATSMPSGSHVNDISVVPVKHTDNGRESVSNTMPGPLIGPLFTQSLMLDKDKSDWALKPEQLILHAPSKVDDRPEVSKFQIINFLNKEMRFKMSWLGQWVKITPETVTVQPKSTTSICISPSARVFQNMETLPWRGTVHVSCGEQYKTLQVQIRTDIQTEEDAANRNLAPLYKQVSSATSICIPAENRGVQVNTSQVNFPPTKVGDMSETYVDLTNVASENLRWTISIFAPPYVKGADNSKDVFRATYKVFSFSEKYGHLEGNQSTQICVQFMPRSQGAFSQYWEVQSRGSTSNSVRIELKGEGFDEEKKTKESETRKRTDALFTLENEQETQEFLPCDIGHVQMIKVQLKNRSSAPQIVEVVPPQLPFVVKHSSFTLKPRSFLRFPIEFRPSGYGIYDGLVIFKADVGSSVSCKVRGVCQKL